MTREEAEKYADNMTYRDAINNLMKAKSIPYRKATFIKVNELLKVLEQEPCKVGHWISNAEDDLKISEYTCSNCKGLSDEDSDFCPKCGSYNGGTQHDD